MEFLAGRGSVAATSDDGGSGGRFPEPPQQHGDSSSMLVIRDALLSQLQKDRLRQEIIMIEVAKIERGIIALRSADAQRANPPAPCFFSSNEHRPLPCALPTPNGLIRRPSAEAQRADPPPFCFFPSNEHFTPQSGGADGAEHGVGADDEVRDLKKEDGAVQEGVELKPAMEDLAGECSKTSCGTGKAAGQEDAALNECKMQESSETMLLEKTPPSSVTWSGGTDGAEHGVNKDEVHDLKKEDEAVQKGVELKPGKPAMEDLGGECFKPCFGTGKATGPENAALNECESSETMLLEKTPPSSVTWSCSICQAKATSEGTLQQHFAGQKHQSKVAALVSRKSAYYQKATLTAEQASNVRQYAAEKRHPTWRCIFCQSNCTCKSDLESHLRGKRHKAKIQALLDECKNMATNFGSTDVKLDPHIVTHDEENPVSTWNCSLCQAKCTRQSELENHLKGKRHQMNFLVLQVEAQQYLSEWGCAICEAKCKSAFQFEDHCRGRRHQQKIEALLRGDMNPRPTGFQAAKKPPSDGSNSKGKSSEEMETQTTLYFCKLCNLHCNSKYTLAKHRQGKKHIEKVGKRTPLSYCGVCNLQCNSEKMLAHHCTGKTHLAKVNGCGLEV